MMVRTACVQVVTMVEILAPSRGKCAASWLRLLSNATLVKKSAFVLNCLRSFCVDLSTELRNATGVTNQSNLVERKRFDRISSASEIWSAAKTVRVTRETLLLPQFVRRPNGVR